MCDRTLHAVPAAVRLLGAAPAQGPGLDDHDLRRQAAALLLAHARLPHQLPAQRAGVGESAGGRSCRGVATCLGLEKET